MAIAERFAVELSTNVHVLMTCMSLIRVRILMEAYALDIYLLSHSCKGVLMRVYRKNQRRGVRG